MVVAVWCMMPFAAIGFFIVLMLLCGLVLEIIRAIRQGHRIATVMVRGGGDRHRRATLREWFRCFKSDFFRGYSSLVIRFIEIPHDPSKPLRARLPI